MTVLPIPAKMEIATMLGLAGTRVAVDRAGRVRRVRSELKTDAARIHVPMASAIQLARATYVRVKQDIWDPTAILEYHAKTLMRQKIASIPLIEQADILR
jgi:hypothetical protein